MIRLGAEANDTGNANADPQVDLGTDPSQYGDWARYWANVAQAMNAVTGAHFLFDWTVNQHVQPIPLDEWYPGDGAVNIIGIDAYDSGIGQSGLTPAERWQKLSNESDGLNAVAAFAQSHNKPLSIPEWGLAPLSQGGAGDDPTYVAGLASIIRNNDVIYNSIFYDPRVSAVTPLTDAPLSLATYRQDIVMRVNAARSAGGIDERSAGTMKTGVLRSMESRWAMSASLATIIVTHNCADTVAECLRSVSESSVPSSLFVVDNASSDATTADGALDGSRPRQCWNRARTSASPEDATSVSMLRKHSIRTICSF